MLKTCWDWITGRTAYGDREQNDVSVGPLWPGRTQRAPPWPRQESPSAAMFLLPRALNFGDRIEVSGIMRNNPHVLTVSLLPETMYQNIVCEIEANFDKDNMSIKIVENGNQEIVNGSYQDDPATNYFTDSDFKFTLAFTIQDNVDGHLLTIYVRDTFLEQIKLKHSMKDIRYIKLDGDVEKVDQLLFKFV